MTAIRSGLVLILLATACADDGAATDSGGSPGPDREGGGGEGEGAGGGRGEGEGEGEGDEAPDALPLGIDARCNPLASTSECLFPFPSRAFQVPDESTETKLRTVFPRDVLTVPPGAPDFDFSTLALQDGASPSAPLLVHLGVDVAEAHLVGAGATDRSLAAGSDIAVFDRVTGERAPLLVEADLNLREPGYEGRHVLILRPMAPLRMGHEHVAVISARVRDEAGRPLAAPPGFVALRDGVRTDHPALEAARGRFEGEGGHFDFLDGQGYPRDELLLAWDFVVASRRSVLGPILSMRDRALARVRAGELSYSVDEVLDDPTVHAARIVHGTFEVPSFLTEANAIERGPDGLPVERPDTAWFPYTLLIPAAARRGAPLPLGVFGHGIFGSGRGYLAGGLGEDVIQPMADQAGAVLVATDWIGLSDGDRELIVREVVQDLARIHVVTDRLQQALVNNLVLTELALGPIQADPGVWEGDLLSGVVHYYGVSLGGVQGASFTGLSPHVRRAVLAVPGGAWATLLSRSVVYTPIKQLVDAFYPDPLLQQGFVAMLQARFDGSDGVNLGRLLFADPLADAPPAAERTVLLQEAIGDCQVPNLATRILARAIGARQLTPAYEPVWGLDSVDAPVTGPGAFLAQHAMPDRLAEYTPPEGNLVPDRDNGTHSDALLLPPAVEQVMRLVRDGMVIQPCDGACDPD